MPQPSTTKRRKTVPQAPKAPEKTPEQIAAEEQDAAWLALVERATSGDGSGAKQIARAVTLERERADVMKRVSDNRDYLRLMDRNDELDADQAEFIDTFYPEKERGDRRSKDDIEATRRARELARHSD